MTNSKNNFKDVNGRGSSVNSIDSGDVFNFVGIAAPSTTSAGTSWEGSGTCDY